jgi:chemotaxis protein MotB
VKPKYLQNGADRRDRWMVSYVDVLTIVLVFFLVAAAKVPKVVAVPVPPRAAPAPPAPLPVAEPLRADLLRAERRLQDRGLKPTLEARGLVISLPQAILFGAGADKVSPRAYSTVGAIAEVLRAIPNEVRLIGYADTVPIHTRRFHSNWDLSMARSQRILELLSSRYGIAESRLSIASYGAYRPAAPNDTADGRASNRRVEIVILAGRNRDSGNRDSGNRDSGR